MAVAPASAKRARIDAEFVIQKGTQNSRDPIVQAQAIEALVAVRGAAAGDVYVQALEDPDPRVRFAGAIAIATTRYYPAKTRLQRMAEYKKDYAERDKRVYAGVIGALHRLGDKSHSADFRALLFDNEAEVRAGAAMALGKAGDPVAGKLLADRLLDEQMPMVRLQILESMAELGDRGAAMKLEAYALRPALDEKLAALPACQRVNSPNCLELAKHVLAKAHSPRVRVAALDVMAREGEVFAEGYNYVLLSAQDPKMVMTDAYKDKGQASAQDLRSLRQLAAITMGSMGKQESLGVLQALLKDPDGTTRLAAAMSILRLLGDKPTMGETAEPQPTQRPVTVVPPQPEQTLPTLRRAGGRD
jgi:HEAT repeat protein